MIVILSNIDYDNKQNSSIKYVGSSATSSENDSKQNNEVEIATSSEDNVTFEETNDDYIIKIDNYFTSSEFITDISTILDNKETYYYVFSGEYSNLTSTKLMYKAFEYTEQQLISNMNFSTTIEQEYFKSKLEAYFKTEQFYNIYIYSKINEAIELYCYNRELERN